MSRKKEKVDAPTPDDAAASVASASASAASATPASAATPAVVIPPGYSLDRGEAAIRLLNYEATELRRRAERGESTTAERMRSKEIETELKEQSQHDAHATWAGERGRSARHRAMI